MHRPRITLSRVWHGLGFLPLFFGLATSAISWGCSHELVRENIYRVRSEGDLHGTSSHIGGACPWVGVTLNTYEKDVQGSKHRACV